MSCGTCGAANRAGAKFCSECGTPQSLACPQCAAPITASEKFCSECGTALTTSSTTPSTPAPHVQTEERRFVTALFIDLVGFTPLTEARDGEEVRRMLTVYFDRAREIVDRFGGVIDKYIGDAVMAVWGAHTAHEDDAERAVRAGLELVEAVQVVGEELGLAGLRARAGAVSGEAVVGGDGNAVTGLIVGDTVNTASRLQGAAEPGTVLVSRSIRDLAANSIEFESMGEFELKGKEGSVEAWRAVRILAGTRGNRRSDGLVPPFVGRTDELRLLKDNLHASERDGRLRLVSVVGQGGIGKSRLIDEFWSYVDGLTQTTYWHHGRSLAYGEHAAYWAVGEMVRQRCGITEGDDQHKTRTRLRTALAEFVADADDRAWMEPKLESLLGISDAPAERAELFGAWRLFFTGIAMHDPVVMVFEDLHLADDGMLDFIEEFNRTAAELPILVVTLARPELLERRSGWGSGRTNSVSLHLAPLSPGSMRDLLLGLVPDAPEELVLQLVERAGGVPLYAVELVRMLIDRGSVEAVEDGRFHMRSDVGTVDIPDSLHGLVGARLDQFPSELRALIADVAILGQSFKIEGLAALRETDTGMLEAELEHLVRAEVLTVNRDPRSPERGQYQFVQSIIREVAHDRVSRSDRLRLHQQVAEFYESRNEPELAGITASHYLDALEAADEGSDTSVLRSKTIASLLSSADRADRMGSHGQVVELCLRGVDLADGSSERGELLAKAARAAHSALDERARDLATQSIEEFAQADNPLGRIKATTVFAKLLDDVGDSNMAWPPLLEALEAHPGETPDHAIAIAELGRALMLDGQPTALEWIERGLGVAEPLRMVPTIAELWATKGAGLGGVLRMREAFVILEAALELTREHQLSATKRRVMTNINFISGAGMDPYLDERLDDAMRVGDRRLITEALITKAQQALFELDWETFESVVLSIEELPMDARTVDEIEELKNWRTAYCGDPAGAAAADEARWKRQGPGDQQVEANRRDFPFESRLSPRTPSGSHATLAQLRAPVCDRAPPQLGDARSASTQAEGFPRTDIEGICLDCGRPDQGSPNLRADRGIGRARRQPPGSRSWFCSRDRNRRSHLGQDVRRTPPGRFSGLPGSG